MGLAHEKKSYLQEKANLFEIGSWDGKNESVEGVLRSVCPRQLRLLHVSDTHLALADGRDGERKQALAARRSLAFGKEEVLN